MTQDWNVPGWIALATLAAVLVLVVLPAVLTGLALRRSSTRTAALLADARDELATLGARVDALEQQLRARAEQPERAASPDYVITRLGDEPAAGASTVPAVPSVPAPLFADLVLREGVVQAASYTAGLRRALSPEVRHRIRFEMRREVKRARKQRKSDLRRARRALEDRRAEGSAA